MDDLGGMINSFLSQPGAMEQLQSMAKQLGLGAPETPETEREQTMPDGISPEMVSRVLTAFSEASKQDEVTDFLEALRALLRPDRQPKIDRAIRAVHLMRAARTVTGATELIGL